MLLDFLLCAECKDGLFMVNYFTSMTILTNVLIGSLCAIYLEGFMAPYESAKYRPPEHKSQSIGPL